MYLVWSAFPSFRDRRWLSESHFDCQIDFAGAADNLEKMGFRTKGKQVTLIDLGKMLNLTPRAVSKALNGEDSTVRVSKATQERVQALAKQLNYRPNRSARTLRTGKSGMAGIIAFQAFGHLFQHKLYLARNYAEKYGFVPNFYIVPDFSETSRDRAVNAMLDSKVDAVIIFNDLGKPRITELEKAGIPVVVVGAIESPSVPIYYADPADGFFRIAKHLLENGNTNLTFLRTLTGSESAVPWYAKRARKGIERAAKGFRAQGDKVTVRIQTQNVSYDGFMVKEAPGIHGLHAGGYLGMKEIIRRQELPDALVCNGDNDALGALLACRESEIEIPRTMRITGFGDDPSSSAGLLPLTTVRPPFDELCRMAFEDLQQMSLSRKRIRNRCVTLPYELIVRASSHSPGPGPAAPLQASRPPLRKKAA